MARVLSGAHVHQIGVYKKSTHPACPSGGRSAILDPRGGSSPWSRLQCNVALFLAGMFHKETLRPPRCESDNLAAFPGSPSLAPVRRRTRPTKFTMLVFWTSPNRPVHFPYLSTLPKVTEQEH